MLIIFVIAFVLGGLIYGFNHKSEALRWGSAAFFASGLSALSVYFDTEASNVILHTPQSEAEILLVNSLNFFTDAGMAFTFGMFCMTYSRLFAKKRNIQIGCFWIVYFLIVWLLTPLSGTLHINYEGTNGWWMYSFASLCLLPGISFLWIGYFKEKNQYKKMERLLTNILISPSMLWIYFTCYLLYILGSDLYKYNFIFAIIFLCGFLFFGITKGIFGIKIKVEQLKADAALTSFVFFNHQVKDNIGKLDIILDNLGYSLASETGFEKDKVSTYDTSIGHAKNLVCNIRAMMEKIQRNMEDVPLLRSSEDLISIVEDSLEHIVLYLRDSIKIVKHFGDVPLVFCDREKIKEVISNILNNAVEAMDDQGELTVSIHDTSKEVIINFHDTGIGISKDELPHIFESFYTTKNSKTNYGVGLVYCKKVMSKHGGSIHVESIKGKGTKVSLFLPK